MNTQDMMRDEYDLTNGEVGKFFGKVNTKESLIEDEEESEQGLEDISK